MAKKKEAATAEAPTRLKGEPDKREQQFIEGTEPPKIAEIEKKAKQYKEDRDERMAWTKKEVEGRAVLIEAMKRHNLTTYTFGDQIVRLKVGKDKIEVRSVESESEDE